MPRRPQDTTARAPEGSEHGTGEALQRLADAAPLTQPEGGAASPVATPGPIKRAQVERGAPAPTEYATEADRAAATDPSQLSGSQANGGLDEVLFAPSDQPGTPLTNGMDFGDGTTFQPQTGESPRAFQLRVADALLSSPTADQRVKDYAKAIALGR